MTIIYLQNPSTAWVFSGLCSALVGLGTYIYFGKLDPRSTKLYFFFFFLFFLCQKPFATKKEKNYSLLLNKNTWNIFPVSLTLS